MNLGKYYVKNLEMTIDDFFTECNYWLWKECEGFSGKRPLGDSGWA